MSRIAATIGLLLIAFNSATWAQAGGENLLLGDHYPIRVRSFGGSGNPALKRCLAANLNGDLRLDMVMHRGQRPVMVSGPGLYSAMTRYPAGAGTPDLAVLPASVAGQVDEVLTIGTSLKAWKYDRPNDQFLSRTLGTPAVWDGVTILCCAQIDGAATHDVIGAEGDTIHVLLNAGDMLQSEYSFTCARDVLEILPFVRNAAGNVQLALRCELGVLIYSIAGNLQQAFVGAGEGALATANSGDSYDDIAWIQTGATDELSIIANDGTDLTLGSSALDLGSLGVIAATGADLDGDGDEELLISHTSACELTVLIHRPDGFTFDADNTQVIDFGAGDASSNKAVPATGDFDNDGDLEVALAIRDHRYLYIVENDTTDHDALSPIVSEEWMRHHCEGNGENDLRIVFALGTLPNPDLQPGEQLCIEIGMWTKPSATEPTEATGQRFIVGLGDPEPSIDLPLPATYPGFDFDEIIFWVAAYAVIDASGDTVAVYPPRIRGFTSMMSGPSLDYLRGLPGGWAETPLYTLFYPEGACGAPSDGTNDGDTKPTDGFDDDGDPGK